MKVLITYASSGAGHYKTAEAIYRYLQNHSPRVSVRMYDILDFSDPFMQFYYRDAYSLLISRLRFFWRLGYLLTDIKIARPFARAIAKVTNRIGTRRFAALLTRLNPEVIISTHFLSSEIAAFLKTKRKIQSRIVTLITDLGVHPYWISEGVDLYIAPSGFAKRQLLAEGIPTRMVEVYGIPVDEKFLRPLDRKTLSRKLGISDTAFTVLLMTGSFGIGPLERITEELSSEAQLLVVCASNKKLYARLLPRASRNVKVFGFVDNVEELMAVSDLIITKPGGQTIAEILDLELVPIFVSAIPGHEAANAQVLESYGVGITPRNIDELKRLVMEFKYHPEKLQRMREAIKKLKMPKAVKVISDVICENSAGAAC